MTAPFDPKAARLRCEAAPEGPWTVQRGDYPYAYVRYEDGEDTSVMRGEDAEFVAHARADLPAALDLIEAQAKEIAELRSLLRALSSADEAIRLGRAALIGPEAEKK